MRKIDPNKPLPHIHHREIVAQSKLFRVESLDLEFSNGEKRQFERMAGGNRGAVMIVPMYDKDTLVLIREYAAGVERYELALPKGKIDGEESILEAANRELKEEVGFGAEQLEPLKKVSMAPSYFNATMHILFAQGLYPQTLEGDEPEPLVVVKWPLTQWQSLLQQDDFTEARSVAALLLLMKRIDSESGE